MEEVRERSEENVFLFLDKQTKISSQETNDSLFGTYSIMGEFVFLLSVCVGYAVYIIDLCLDPMI